MNEASLELLEALPEDGSKITGGDLREKIDLKRSDFDAAKKELKELGLITLGRGRGGSVSRVVGAEIPEAPKKLSKAEVAEIARQAREEKTRAHKRRIELEE